MGKQFVAGQIIDSKYRLARPLGGGAFGEVWAAEELLRGQPVGEVVAVKFIRLADETHFNMCLREVQALAQMRHDHILQYRTSGLFDGGVCVVSSNSRS